MIVDSISLSDYRSYARLELALEPGLVLVVGPNGAGKTNLLESLHVATQGFSSRTRADSQLVRFGSTAARVAVNGRRADAPLEIEIVLRLGEAKRARLNGAPLRAAEQLRTQTATLVFTPDRLSVVKGGPAVRRAYFDRVVGRLLPARSDLPALYAAALGQRNAALRRAAAGVSSVNALEPWTQRVAELGRDLVAARTDAVSSLSPRFRHRAAEFGLADAVLRYVGQTPTVETLAGRLARDLDRGVTGLGPHLDDVGVASGERDLRSFGSQGEQRVAVLALLLAEAELIEERGGETPLLLLDDVLSELDFDRRFALANRVAASGQTLVSATSRDALPIEPTQLLHVSPGRVEVET